MAVQLLYCDPAASESGITGAIDHPYTRLDAAISAATGNDTVLYVRRGRVYTNTGSAIGVINVNSKSPTEKLLITPYGDEAMPPTLMGGLNMLPGDPGWSYVGAGVWKRALLYNAAGTTANRMRLFVGGSRITGAAVNRALGTGYTFGTAVAKCTVADNAAEAAIIAEMHIQTPYSYRIWTYTTDSTGYLYVWTGSDTLDPPTFYDGITLVGTNGLVGGTGWGKTCGVSINNSSNVTVDGIDAIFCVGGNALTNGSAAAVYNCTLSNSRSYAFGSSGLVITGFSPTRLVTGFAARNCLNDAVATMAEEWNYRDKGGLSWLNGSQDAAVLGHYTDACTFENVETIDGAHLNTLIGTMDAAKDGYTTNARLINCTARNPNRAYGTALNIAGIGVGASAYVDRFHGSDTVAFISRTGSGKAIISNSSFKDAKKPYDDYDYVNPSGSGAVAVNSIPGVYIYVNAGFGAVEAGCITLKRSSIMNPYGFMFAITEYGVPGTIPTGSFVATDSLFVDRTNLDNTDARRIGASQFRPGISWDMRDSSQAGVASFTNCYSWTGVAGTQRVMTGFSTYVTYAGWAGLTGAVAESDPMVDERGYLLAGSPLKYVAPLADLAYDVDGRARSNPTSIGAHEYVEPRASRL